MAQVLLPRNLRMNALTTARPALSGSNVSKDVPFGQGAANGCRPGKSGPFCPTLCIYTISLLTVSLASTFITNLLRLIRWGQGGRKASAGGPERCSGTPPACDFPPWDSGLCAGMADSKGVFLEACGTYACP
jgi:hypothetical protein